MGQLIYRSVDLRAMYEDCVVAASVDSAVSMQFQNLRAAKQRFETFVTPLSRSVLNLTALLAFAVKLGIARRGRPEGEAADVVFADSQCPHRSLSWNAGRCWRRNPLLDSRARLREALHSSPVQRFG